MDSETTRPISIPPTTAEDVSSTDTSRKDVARHIDNAPLMTMAQTLFAQSAPTTIAPLSEEGRMAGSRRSLERPSSPPAIQTKTSSSSVFARQPLPSMASNAASLLSSVGASGTGKGVSVKSFSKSVAGSQVSTGTTASILSSISLAGSPEKLWVQTQNDTRANARPNLTQEPLPWDGTMSHNTRPMRIPDHQAGVEIPTDSMAPLPSTRHPLSLNHMHQHERYSSDNTTATATSTASPTGQTMMDHPAFFPPLACTTGPLYQTMPRMSSGIIRTSPFSTTPKVARRAHSTKVSSAPGRVLIKKRASLQQQDSFGEAVSPVTSESFSSLGQSPAISFLASMSDALSILHSPNASTAATPYYEAGDSVGDYLLTKELGSGTFSRVYEASILESNDPPVAIKVIHRDPGQPYFDKTALRRESYLWSKLSHPHLLRMFESFETDDAIFVVMELAKDGPLLDYVLKNGHPGLPEPLAKSFFSQIASALQYLHTTMGIVHRDVKLENILVDESTKTVKLADFGLSVPVSEHFWESYSDLMDAYDPPIGTSGKDKAQPGSPLPAAQPGRGTSSRAPIPGPGNHHHVRSQSTVHSRPLQSMTGTSSAIQISTSHNDPSTSSSVCAFTQGSLHYCAPETLQAQSQVSLSSDIWSLGCVLHALLTGSLPFNDSYLPRLQLSIVHGRWDPGRLERAGVSAEARELVTRMLNVNVAERLTINGVLSHPWLRRQ